MSIYAGIGSHQTPPQVLALMTRYARHLADKPEDEAVWWLSSGGARGADTAFQLGVQSSTRPGRLNIWRPEHVRPIHLDHAAQFHPAWDRCPDYAKRLHARNSIIILGPELDQPVSFIMCWTPNAAISGGTGQALRIARAHSIPVYNLANASTFTRVWNRAAKSALDRLGAQ